MDEHEFINVFPPTISGRGLQRGRRRVSQGVARFQTTGTAPASGHVWNLSWDRRNFVGGPARVMGRVQILLSSAMTFNNANAIVSDQSQQKRNHIKITSVPKRIYDWNTFGNL